MLHQAPSNKHITQAFSWAIRVVVLMVAMFTHSVNGWCQETMVPYQLQEVTVNEQLNNTVNTDLSFTDHRGEAVKLGEYFADGKPVLLTLNYYSCATLCSLQLNALLDGLRELDWTPGDQFRIVTVSIDPREDYELAFAKRASYLNALGEEELDWHFLVGDEKAITELAHSVGFSYSYDASTDQFAHPAVLTFLSDQGIVSRYLYGLSYPARDLKFALIETSEGRVGSPVDKLILSCFRYDSAAGRYTATIFGLVRFGAILTILALGIFGFVMWRRELALEFNGSMT